jgi:O-antigen/teichoic acid export membrane protein
MIGKLIMAIVTILLVRLLSTEDYAIYTNFSEIGNIFLSIVGTGLSIPFVTYSVEQYSRGINESNTLYNTCCFLIVALTFVALAFLPIATDVYNLSYVLATIGIIYGSLQSLNKLAQSFFQAKNEFRKSGIVTNFKNVSLLIFLVFTFLILKKTNATIASVITALSALVAFVAASFWIFKENNSIGLHFSASLLKKLISESKWLILYLIFQSFFSSVCIVILNAYGTQIDVANFGVANKYYNLLLMFLTSLQTVLRVKTCQKEMVDSAEKRREFSVNWLKKVWPLAGSVCLVAVLSAGVILPFLNGDGYAPSITVFRVLMLSVFFGYVFSPNTSIMIAAKRHKLLFFLAVGCCVIGAAICYFLLPVLGVVAAAISITISNLLLNLTGFIIIMKAK